jgi:hypothetical protein
LHLALGRACGDHHTYHRAAPDATGGGDFDIGLPAPDEWRILVRVSRDACLVRWDAILSRDGAVVVSDVDKVIAQMAENGAIPKGTVVSGDLYLLPRALGGLAR